MMIVNIHNYAGKGYTKTVELNQTPEKYLKGVQSTGYAGQITPLIEKLYKGETVTIDQFSISFFYRPDQNP